VTAARPLLKFVGGKGSLLPTLMPLLTKAPIAAYHEPFVGGGAVFFALRASGYAGPASLSDSSPDLIGAYQAVRDRVEALITLLHAHALDHGEEHYYCVRKSLRLFKTPVERAAAFIYLNKTCFTPGSMVLMEDETCKPIEDVKVGDRLWNGRTVKKKLSRLYNGLIRRIRVQGSPYTMSLTADHPVLSMIGKRQRRQDWRSIEERKKTLQLRPASELQANDCVMLPTRGTQSRKMNWEKYWPDAAEFGPQAVKVRLSSSVSDQDVARFLGYYAAEGQAMYGYYKGRRRIRGVSLSFNEDERRTYIKDVVDICRRLFSVEPHIYPSCVPGKKEVSVQVNSCYVGKFVTTLVSGQGWSADPAKRKTSRLHQDLLTAPPKVQLELLKGWLRGDGGYRYRPSTNSSELDGTCTVLPMAKQLYRMAQRCGLKPSWGLTYPKGNENAHLRFSGLDVGQLGFKVEPMKRKRGVQRHFVDGYLAVRIRSIVDLEYSGRVYNLHVDGDHLITVDNVVSHNCFNGLWRVNSRGEFNVPMGRYVNPTICDADNLRACSAALQGADLTTWDFSHALSFVKPGETAYLDPPYVPTSETANFTRYSKNNFLAVDQERLAGAFRQLDQGGARLILSNADHPVVRKLYRDYHFKRVQARRSINSDGAKRGAVGELIVTNF
jgi:site-specific DNA-adenine methylase